MNHTLDRVAASHFLSERKLTAFARQPVNKERFSLVESGPDLTVSTWHVDGLIDAFKKTQSKEELEKDRQQAIRDLQSVCLC